MSNVNPPPKSMKVEKVKIEDAVPGRVSKEKDACITTVFFVCMCIIGGMVVCVFAFMDGAEPIKKVVITKFSNSSELATAIDNFAKNITNVTVKYGAAVWMWDVSNLTNFDYICSAERNPMMATFPCNISSWNTTKATSMAGMFMGNTKFNGNLTKWNVSKVVNMANMFNGATNFSGVGLEMWKLAAVNNTSFMFEGAGKFNANLTTWNVSNVVTMEGMFADAVNFTGTGLASWNAGSVENIASMFKGTSEKFAADLGSWDIANTTTMTGLFCDSGLNPFLFPFWMNSDVLTCEVEAANTTDTTSA